VHEGIRARGHDRGHERRELLATENRFLSRVSFKNGAESLFDGFSWLPSRPCLTPTTGFARHQHEGNINKLRFLCFLAV